LRAGWETDKVADLNPIHVEGPIQFAMVMGVPGSGKSTVGAAPAIRPGWAFVDGEAWHPPGNIAKRRVGQPLGDSDREPWLSAVPARIDNGFAAEIPGVATWSALKRCYRDAIIRNRNEIPLVYLKGSSALIGKGLTARRDHSCRPAGWRANSPRSEPPSAEERPIVVSIDQPVEGLSSTLSPLCHCGRRA
jgi:gluconokinase